MRKLWKIQKDFLHELTMEVFFGRIYIDDFYKK